MIDRKAHFVNYPQEEKSLCGKKLKSHGLIDPIEEVDKEKFLTWDKRNRCQICEKKLMKHNDTAKEWFN